MKKTLLTSALVLGMVSGANAFTINPYVGGAVSFNNTTVSDMERVIIDHLNPSSIGYSIKTGGDESFNSVRGYIAAGVEFPVEAAYGAFRTELEIGLGQKKTVGLNANANIPEGDLTDVKIGATTFFLNAFYDFNATDKIKPYAGFGLGLARVSADNMVWTNAPAGDNYIVQTGDKSFNNFAWNVGLGVAYSLTANVALDLGYRYTNMGKLETTIEGFADGIGWATTDRITANLTSHEARFGARYTF
jgi:opacity protein-like surface antigen